MSRYCSALLMLAVTAAPLLPQQRGLPEDKAWLDRKVQQWNKSGASIPHAKRSPAIFDEIPSVCKTEQRAAKTTEERALAAAGWMLFATSDNRSGSNIPRPATLEDPHIVLVGGMANMDGMCRPDMYQYFVFVDGVYAGTLSPRLMDSRSDESAVAIRFPAPGKIAADFTRYSEKDPMCCPSRMTELTFEIAREKGKAVVSWIAAKTRPSDY